ncbi:MAG: DUF3971 domain-containing protein [Porticoccaceae bacterium]
MAVNWKKILVFLARRVWFFSAALLVTLAVLVSLGRQAIDGLESYRPALNEYVSELLGVRFRAQRLSGSWEKLIPSITAEDIALFGDADQTEPAMTLSSLTFDLNFFQSLFSWELIWHELTFGEARLTLQENRQGQWSLAGLSMGGGASGSNLLDVIFLSDHIEIAELQVTLAFYSGTRTIVNARDMVVESDGDFHRLHASLALDGQQESARLVLEGVDDTGSYQDFFGSGYLKLSRINFDGSVNAILKNWFPELVARVGDIQSDLDAEFWIDLQGLDKFEWVGLVRADEIPMNWLADAEPLKNFRAEATGWFSAGNSWGMRWQGVDFDWGEFDIEPFNAVYSQQMGGNWGSGSLYFNRLNVATFAELLQGTKLPPEAILNALDNLQPKGVLKRIHLQIGLQEGDPAVHARMNMDDISIASWHGAPASRQINGYAEFYSEQGVTEGLVELDSPDGFAMYYPAVYPDYMEHSSIKGQVRWRWDQVDSAVKVASGPIAVGGAEGVGRAYLYLDIPVGSDRVPEMFLLAGVKNTHSRYRNRYLPETLNDGLRTWLEYAPTDIDVAEAGFIWRGALKGEHSGRTVQLHLNVENSELAFQPDWLPLKAFNARIDLDDTEFNGAVTKGMLGNVRIDSADVSLISSKETDSTLLLIKAKAEGDMGEVLSVLHQSPLAERVSALQDWNISGNSYLDLDLAIPLTADKAGEHYRVDTTFGNARFTDIAGDLVFEKLQAVASLNDGLNTVSACGTFWISPLRPRLL